MAEQALEGSQVRQRQLHDIWRHALRFQSLFGLIAILIIATILSPERDGENVFLDAQNLLNVVRFAAENGIIAIGMTLVILAAGIDLSVGAVLALCAVATGAGLMRYEMGTVEAALFALGVGTLCGLINGLVTTKVKIPPFITTLAMLSAARGVATLWSDGYAIPLAFGEGPATAPQSFHTIFTGRFVVFNVAIPYQVLYFIGIGVIAAFVLKRTAFGRHVYAVGGNDTAARLSGVNVDRIRIVVFVVSGFLVGVAALLHAALVNQGSPIDGQGYELNAIAAVVIGGTSLFGGVGTVVGSMIGAVILSVLDNILGLMNVQSEYQLILKGVVIVLAVAAMQARRRE